MGMKTTGLVLAEATDASSISAADTVVINHFTTFTGQNNYWEPLEATMTQLASYISTTISGGLTVLGSGSATLASGTATVALSTITSSSLVFVTPHASSPYALGVVITSGTGFVIHSSSGSDTSVVNYIVYS